VHRVDGCNALPSKNKFSQDIITAFPFIRSPWILSLPRCLLVQDLASLQNPLSPQATGLPCPFLPPPPRPNAPCHSPTKASGNLTFCPCASTHCLLLFHKPTCVQLQKKEARQARCPNVWGLERLHGTPKRARSALALLTRGNCNTNKYGEGLSPPLSLCRHALEKKRKEGGEASGTQSNMERLGKMARILGLVVGSANLDCIRRGGDLQCRQKKRPGPRGISLGAATCNRCRLF
jgi:hypothetical protein